MSERTVYADNNATTMVAPEVKDEMLPFLTDLYGNPSSMHIFGGQVKKHLDSAREKVASLINAEPSEIIFTSCGTESDNTAINGILAANPDKNISSQQELSTLQLKTFVRHMLQTATE